MLAAVALWRAPCVQLLQSCGVPHRPAKRLGALRFHAGRWLVIYNNSRASGTSFSSVPVRTARTQAHKRLRCMAAQQLQHAHSSKAAGSLSKLPHTAFASTACGPLSFRGKTAEAGIPMRRRRQWLKRPRWRLVLPAVACAVVWLRFYRRSVAVDALLDIPIRWPECAPDGASYRAAPVKRHAFDGARLAIISTWLPTRCGIATYSAGLRGGLLVTGATVDVVAVHLRSSEEHVYGSEARCEIMPRSCVDGP